MYGISASGETRVTGNLIPSADNAFDLGSTNTEDWRTLFVREIDIFNQRLRITYDGTTATFRDHSSVGDGIKFFHRNQEILTLGNDSGGLAITASADISASGTITASGLYLP